MYLFLILCSDIPTLSTRTPWGRIKTWKKIFFRLDCRVIKSFFMQESLFAPLQVLIKFYQPAKNTFSKFWIVYFS